MNRGLFGMRRLVKPIAFAVTEPGGDFGSQPKYGPLVYHSLSNVASAIADATTLTADQTFALTRDWPAMEDTGLPRDGSVIGVAILMIGRNSAVSAATLLYAVDYHDPNVQVGDAPSHQNGYQMFFGKVAGHYTALYCPIVLTGGKNNVQFKWACDWATGTATVYIRIVGYWTRA